jgi:ribosome-associated protein
MNPNQIRRTVAAVVEALESKKAFDIRILKLDQHASGFTDYFIIASGSNPKQIQTLADEVEKQLSALGQQAAHTEGYRQAEWILLDYVDFVVHVFSEKARGYYELERLWKSAQRTTKADLLGADKKPAKKAAAPAKKTAGKKRVQRAVKKARARKKTVARKKVAKTPARSKAKKKSVRKR